MNLKLAAAEPWRGLSRPQSCSSPAPPLSLDFPTRPLPFVRRVTPASASASAMMPAAAFPMPYDVEDFQDQKKPAPALLGRLVPVQSQRALAKLRQSRALKVRTCARGYKDGGGVWRLT